ncbi:LOW QUALITY PROTEIN: hypothetical protein BCV70DRAFT_211918 [Testicularia cyperi]|uniref:PH-domain-containing protein n=1 Tax=Testicularia cyperi TaxID=1882483 RepID=A0A317XMV0_9BASI|nr:LOW QUALITY PROTEIN: hypothetical protein BCV70DRAFT_211918 [Testicularia cyperi]
MSATAERVWALHDFEAENPDEVSFKAGECILVIEKDDEYGDGWWQGTNERGEQGLFPFTYTTLDHNQALAAIAAAGNLTPDALGTPQAAGSDKPGVMHSTMADIDNALTELQSDRNGVPKATIAAGTDAADTSRASFTSERTDADNESVIDNFNGESAVAARAALAANAQKDLASANEREKLEEQRRRTEAQRLFEEEEARQRELLLEKEKERLAKVAAGEVDPSDEKPKVAPIAGVDMSDESDSEGSIADLDDDFQDKTHSPLFGNLASTPKNGTASREIEPQQPQSLASVVENDFVPTTSSTSTPPAVETATAPAPIAAEAEASPDVAPVVPGALPVAPVEIAAPVTDSNTTVDAPAASSFAPTALAAGAGVGAAVAHSSAAASDPADDSAKVATPSIAGDSVTTTGATPAGTVATGTAPTSVAAAGTDTPRSTGTGGAASTKDNTGMSRVTSGTKPEGDPRDWTVDQGWDETAVEHEISGDMDINILKEIDIIAFGKRFQELKKLIPGAEPDPTGDLLGSPAFIAPMAGAMSQPPSQAPAREGSNADGRSLSARMAETSMDQNPSSSRPASFVDARESGQGFGGPAGHVPRYPSDGYTRGSGDAPISPSAASFMGAGNSPNLNNYNANNANINRYSARSGEDKLGALPSSPRKRESTGSAGVPKESNRSSFFGLGQRNRKPPPPSQSGGPGSVSGSSINQHPEDDKGSKGTLSRLGFARTSRNISNQSSQSNFKDQISLPTSSPHFDQNGDTARRSRNQSGSATGSPAIPAGMSSQARPTSIGSAGPDAAAPGAAGGVAVAAAAAAAGTAGKSGAAVDGPVMARIQPVDLEGWIKKKGERYNSWKPRYLALKGPDLVILRDPRAEKIKGYVNMKGYKVIADENTNPGKYGFKILHESEKPHYFSSDDPILVREWMKALMKSTIGRDHSFPVISSYNNATISLKEAQRMNPPPRPPSPTSRARTQRAKVRPNPEQLTARDAAILMNLTSGARPDEFGGRQ